MNSLHCNICNTTITSRHRHDFVGCNCPEGSDTRIFVDGGNDYQRILVSSASDYTKLAEPGTY